MDTGIVPPAPSAALRSPTGRGCPYRPAVVSAVRALVEGSALTHREIADRTGVPDRTVARWARRHGWVRPGGADADGPTGASPPVARAPRGLRRYAPEDVEAARAAVEGSRASFERIEAELGIGTATLARWKRRGRWQRPSAPDATARPARYRTRPGRPYAADTVEAVRVLATGSRVSHEQIAKRVGIAQDTVSRMIRRRGWERPPARPRGAASFASKRTAPPRTGGDRRGRPYSEETVAAARELFQQTEIPVPIIAMRVGVGPGTVYRWKQAGGWTRPRHLPGIDGQRRGRRRRR